MTTLGSLQNPTTGLPQCGVAAPLIASDTLTTGFQGTLSGVVSVEQARNVVLLVKYAPVASASAAVVDILVAFSYARTAPAIGDDSWFVPTTQVAGTQGALPATIPTGTDFAAASDWQPMEARRTYYALEASDVSEPSREAIVIPCDGARWMYVACSQSGDETNFGTVVVDYVLHV